MMKTTKHILLSLFLFCNTLGFSQSYDIYVSDAANFNVGPWKILKYDQNGLNASTFIDTHLAWPQDILFLEDSNIVLISNFSSGKVTKYDANTGTYLGDFIVGLGSPTRMKIGPDSLLYILQWAGNQKVKRYHLDGTYVDDFTSMGVQQSIGLDWDTAGNLYVSSYNLDHIRKFNPAGQNQGLFISSNLVGPTNIWFAAFGLLYVLDYDGQTLKRFSTNGTFLGTLVYGLNQSEGVAELPNGHFLVGNGGTSSVREYDYSGQLIAHRVSSYYGGLIRPNAVVIRYKNTTQLPEIEKSKHVIKSQMGRKFHLDFNTASKTEVMVYNLNGMIVYKGHGVESIDIDASNWEAGFYFLKYQESKQKPSTIKLVVY